MAGFFRRIFGQFGLFKDEHHHTEQTSENRSPGFTVKRAVLQEKNGFHGPILSQCTPGAGGVQGLQWYAEKLRMDEDGDVAQEFLNEVVHPPQEATAFGETGCKPNLEVRLPAKPVKLKGPLCTSNGNVHQSVESSTGALYWS